MFHRLKLSMLSLALALSAKPVAADGAAGRPWNRSPRLSVMTGFIYEPLKPYTIQQWMENLGCRFDADEWVKNFNELGASHVVFYDKWIDGLVFHDTKTTAFKTRRDFLRELAAACQRGGLPLVIYFNAVSDGNPEFDPWALLDLEGRPIVFGQRWPTRYQTLHSPFRAKCLEQVREILGNYGPIHGIWHDIFHERLNTTSPWTAAGYLKMFGEPFNKASPQRLAEFNARTLADYLDEVDAIRRELRQEGCIFTANGSGTAFLGGGVWTERVGSRLHYLFNEGHSFRNNEKLARIAWALPMHLDINLLLNSSWFAPLEDSPPPAAYSDAQAIAATAIAVCQGAGVNLALTPGHDGRFGEDLQRAKAVGSWFRTVEPWIVAAQPAAEAAIVHGPNADSATDALARAGVFTRWTSPGQPLPTCRAVLVPAQTPVDEAFAVRLCDYVQNGGTLIVCGHPGALADLCGVRVKGMAAFAPEVRGASVKVDSEYNEEFRGHHLLDGRPTTAWASGGTPMPHWAEITLSEPGDVERIEVVSRRGPYQVTDLDVELPDGGGWRTAKSVRGANQPTVLVRLDAPARTDRIRVKIVRELYQGEDRQYADVESIRVLDRAGRNLASGEVVPVELLDAVAGFVGLALPPSAVAVEPTTADVLARFDNAAKSPAVVRKGAGRGSVLLVTADAVGDDSSFWLALSKQAIGEPALLVSDEVAARFRFILTQVADAKVLNVIDAAVPRSDYRPQTIEVSLAGRQVAPGSRAVLAGSDRPLALSEEQERVRFTIRPSPVATVVFRRSTQ
ncbi:MAG: alpha-L-fucosidase [Pirellulales bacterium]|nr:alpha-L-fucosidase [Pirellulales bacterium]